MATGSPLHIELVNLFVSSDCCVGQVGKAGDRERSETTGEHANERRLSIRPLGVVFLASGAVDVVAARPGKGVFVSQHSCEIWQ